MRHAAAGVVNVQFLSTFGKSSGRLNSRPAVVPTADHADLFVIVDLDY